MKNIIAVLAITAATALPCATFAADETSESKAKVEYETDGGYESSRSSEHTTPSGTTHSSESTVDVDVDSAGRVDKTVKTETVTDPKGLMNRKKDVSETEIEEKAYGGYKQTTTRKHKDAAGTDTTFKTVTDVDVDSTGNVTTTATTEKTVDPKGLFNKTTTESKTKTVNGRVVEKNKKID